MNSNLFVNILSFQQLFETCFPPLKVYFPKLKRWARKTAPWTMVLDANQAQ